MGIVLRAPREQLRIALGLAGVVVTMGVVSAFLTAWPEKLVDQKSCFQYDTASDQYVYCGTPEQIENQFRDAGRDWAASGYGVVADPVGLCVARSVAQANMNLWPEKYRQAFEEGCKS